jgi:hypothetical protein
VKTRWAPAVLAASAAATPCRLGDRTSGRCRHREERGRSVERLRDRRRVFERRGNERCSGARERFRLACIGIARDGADLVTSREEAACDGSALFTRGSRDDDSELLHHVLVHLPSSGRTRFQCRGKHIAEGLGWPAGKVLDVAGQNVERTRGEASLDADDSVHGPGGQTSLLQSCA